MQEEYLTYDDSEKEEKNGLKEKIIEFLDSRYFVVLTLILVAIIAFALGRISGLAERREAVKIIDLNEQSSLNNKINPLIKENNETNNISGEVKGVSAKNSSEQVVASKNGTKYHFPWCAGAGQISEKNKIVFESAEVARASGYTPASNCKGLK